MRNVPDTERRSRIDEAASLLGLDKLLGRRPEQMSGGQRQRVAMGRALVRIAGDSDDFRLLYHSKLNWSFGGTMRFNVNKTGFSLLAGALTENDLNVERYSGIRGGVEQKIFHDHLRLALIGESYRTQWNNAVLAAASPGDIYRTRQNIQPTVEVQILPSLVAKAGLSFQRFEYQFLPAARTLSAHSVLSSLRFEREWTGTAKQNLEAGYDLRAATKSLGGEFAYARNHWSARYEAKLGPNEFIADARFGVLGGYAPLGERFVLGNTQTLRGWNRFDVAPLGGSRMAHGTAEYRYRGFRFLYDQGAVWQAQDPDPKVRHSLGVGYIDEGITLVVAFPLRNGTITPLVMLGYTF